MQNYECLKVQKKMLNVVRETPALDAMAAIAQRKVTNPVLQELVKMAKVVILMACCIN